MVGKTPSLISYVYEILFGVISLVASYFEKSMFGATYDVVTLCVFLVLGLV